MTIKTFAASPRKSLSKLLPVLSVVLTASALLMFSSGCAGNRFTRSTGQFIDDQSIQLRVQHALGENPDYKFKDVNVAVFRGNVQLSGFVDLGDERNRAGDIASHVEDVRSVTNNIIVEQNGPRSPGQVVDDKALADRVRDVLHDNPEYKFDGVAVGAYKGIVQLSGFVDVSDQKAKAGEIARHVDGVREIQNSITAKDQLAP